MSSIDFGAIDQNSGLHGAQAANALLQGFAKFRAGRALNRGDVPGAMGELNSAGDLAGAEQVQQRHWAEEDRVKKLTDEQRKESAQFTAEASSALYNHLQQHKGDPDGGAGAVLQGFDQLAPIMKQRGASDEDLQVFRTQLQQDPARFLELVHNEAASHLKSYTLSPGQKLFNEQGQELASVDPKAVPKKYMKATLGDGTQKIFEIDPNNPDAGVEVQQENTPAPQTGHGNFDKFLASGVGINSAGRTPEHNAEVGGVKGSHHLSFEAVDLSPRPGQTMAQLAAEAQANAPDGARVINEGDHVHVQWGAGPGKQAAIREVWTGTPKPVKPSPATAGAKASAATAKLSQSEQAGLQKLRTAQAETQNMAGLMDQFVKLNRDTKTGGSMALPGVGPVLGAVNPNVARMVAITSQLTPAMRNGLPGAASDKDVAMFRAATVGIDKPYEANLATARAAKAFADRQGDYLAFLEDWASKRGTLLGASEVWKGYADSHPLFSEKGGTIRVNPKVPWRSVIGVNAPSSGAPAGVDAKLWQHMTPEERALWK